MTALEFYAPNSLSIQNVVLINDRWTDDEVLEDEKALHVFEGKSVTHYSKKLYAIEKGYGKYVIKRRR